METELWTEEGPKTGISIYSSLGGLISFILHSQFRAYASEYFMSDYIFVFVFIATFMSATPQRIQNKKKHLVNFWKSDHSISSGYN